MKALLLGAGLLLAAVPALADVLVDGQVRQPHPWTLAELKALPPASAEVTYMTGHGEENARFTGVPLWTLLGEAKLADEQGKMPGLRHSVLVSGRDGYSVALSFGEFDPDFEGKAVLLAWQRDGKDLEAPQLVVPGDKRGGRYVHDVVRIEVK
jgi:DMSO/TMAO reductase YedYZ molybdopterin-dependent catalytic subunit